MNASIPANYGPLRFIERTLPEGNSVPRDHSVQPSARPSDPSAAAPTVVLLHGFGASAADLVDLADPIDAAIRHAFDCGSHDPVRYIFPHAPVPIEVAGMSYGRAWFPRDPQSLHAALYGGYFQDLRGLEDPAVAEAAHAVRALIEDCGADWRRVVVGGFSQGAIVSSELLRQAVDGAPAPRVALLFAGALIGAKDWAATAQRCRSARQVVDAPQQAGAPPRYTAVFQSHGRQDSILPFEQGVALSEAITSLGYALHRHDFVGGHTIDSTTIAALCAWLSSTLGADAT